MKKNDTPQSGLCSLHACPCSARLRSRSLLDGHRNAAGLLSVPKHQRRISQRTLTFAERVAYQRAIEEVYWRHRIWPRERPDPKPSLDAVMSQGQLKKKVADYLRNRRRWRTTGSGQLLPSSYKPKWIGWQSTPGSRRCCANCLKRWEMIPLLSLSVWRGQR